jgi:two-component system sensor histidine kinase PhoQ
MKGLLRHIFPLSLRVRFLLATAGVVLVLSLAYGMVALVGYSVSFDKTTFACCAARAISFICWRNGKTALLTSISRKT